MWTKLVVHGGSVERSCELCGRQIGDQTIWFQGQMANDSVVVTVAAIGGSDQNSTCTICGERCAADFVAVWVCERELRHRSEGPEL